MSFPECPPSLKPIQIFLKAASEHDSRDFVVAYWCRLHALQVALKLSSKKTPEETKMLMALMDWLEETKKNHKDNESITNEVAAQAHLENYALKLFLYADKQDREMNYGKNIVKAFYTSGVVYDVLTTFGELTDEAAQNRKYAKWKATYIHNCLRNGETPVPGPMPIDDENAAMGTENQNPSVPSPSTNPTPDLNLPYSGFQDSSSFQPGYPTISPVQPPEPMPPNDPMPTVPSSFGATLPDPNAVNRLPPVPVTPDPNPGGFVPYEAPPSRPTAAFTNPTNSNVHLSAEQITKAQKYCKWANSALNYEDIKTAITNLNNALQLLSTGIDPA